jgi:hypothetical protein
MANFAYGAAARVAMQLSHAASGIALASAARND